MSLRHDVNLFKRQRFMPVGHILSQSVIKELVKFFKSELIQYLL